MTLCMRYLGIGIFLFFVHGCGGTGDGAQQKPPGEGDSDTGDTEGSVLDTGSSTSTWGVQTDDGGSEPAATGPSSDSEEACDPGYEPDAAGGCRLIDPCATDETCAASFRECENREGDAVCGPCVLGYHDATGVCVVDEVCLETTCGGHGSCDDAGGTPVCTCLAGYAGANCAECAEGYLALGSATCCEHGRQDKNENGICLPDCNTTTCGVNEVCTYTPESPGTASCTCAPGFTGEGCSACASGFTAGASGGCAPTRVATGTSVGETLTAPSDELPDTITGLEGDDVISGGAGDDDLYGNQGKDTLYGNMGRDTLHGGKDDDTLFGGKDDDHLYGDLGNDELNGDLGNDILEGGDGYDTYIADGRGDDVIIEGTDLGGVVVCEYEGAAVPVRFEDSYRLGDDYVLVFDSGAILTIKAYYAGRRVDIDAGTCGSP